LLQQQQSFAAAMPNLRCDNAKPFLRQRRTFATRMEALVVVCWSMAMPIPFDRTASMTEHNVDRHVDRLTSTAVAQPPSMLPANLHRHAAGCGCPKSTGGRALKFLVLFLMFAGLLYAAGAFAQQPTAAEARADKAFTLARKAGAPELFAFLKPFPKGADLHMHFSGAVYAETFIAEAVRDNLCVDPLKLALRPNAGLTKSLPPQPVCAAGDVPAATAFSNQGLYDRLIDSLSLRSFVPESGYSGHDQFFDTFDRFIVLNKSNQPEWLAQITARAASQNEQYVEIMTTPDFGLAIAAEKKTGWPADFNDGNHMQVLAKLRDELFADGLKDDVAIDSRELHDAEAGREHLQGCDNDPGDTLKAAGYNVVYAYRGACEVRVHWLYQVLRGFAPQQVFAQALLGFETASQHPEQVVGINLVRAEDRRDAMAEYHTEMLMFDYLHSVYPKVHISLHAGELWPGLVPPEGLTFHIREAIELGHAERIGHGIDILFENRPQQLLDEMAAKHIDVEINLVSNQGILGVMGKDHPLNVYRAAHVPFSLSTDDEGVSRTDLTRNYVQAVTDQGLGYADLKTSARNSLEYSFLPGASLYQPTGTAPQVYAHRVSVCAGSPNAPEDAACKAYLAKSEKAAEQWELERRFALFEAGIK
jgi:adenosine deaminase